MSASILRELISSCLSFSDEQKINPRQVFLSGEIPSDFTCMDEFKDGSMGHHSYQNVFYGFAPKKGFILIKAVIGSSSSSNYAHSDSVYQQGLPLYEVEGVEEFLFFVHIRKEDNQWSGSEQGKTESCTLYKAAKFAAKKQKIENEDIERWEQWLQS